MIKHERECQDCGYWMLTGKSGVTPFCKHFGNYVRFGMSCRESIEKEICNEVEMVEQLKLFD